MMATLNALLAFWGFDLQPCVSSCSGPTGVDVDPTLPFTGKRNQPFSVCARVFVQRMFLGFEHADAE